MDDAAVMIERLGVPIAMLLFFVWRDYQRERREVERERVRNQEYIDRESTMRKEVLERESYLEARIDETNRWVRDVLLQTINEATTAINKLETHLEQVVDREKR